SGLQRARQGMRTAANEIARSPIKDSRRPVDLNRSLVELKQHENAARANIKTLKTAFDTVGTLLDEMA
ncbi:MAG: hydrolase, partial [Gammaproteobacteria bacterium]